MKGNRSQRLSGEFQKEISNIISVKLRNKFSDMSAIISVTEVDVAPDLKSANVYVSIFDTDKAKAENTFEIIKENAGFIRFELSKIMRTRTVPELRFASDKSMEYGAKIDKILNGLESKDNDL